MATYPIVDLVEEANDLCKHADAATQVVKILPFTIASKPIIVIAAPTVGAPESLFSKHLDDGAQVP